VRRRFSGLKVALSLLALGAASSAATVASATQILTGSINATFADHTAVHLRLSAPGMIETGGVALLPRPPGDSSFTMTAGFLGANAPDSYDDFIILASLDPSFDNSALSITLDGQTIAASQFVDAAAFGIPFPPNGINGIANGAGGYLSLNGAVVAAWEFDTQLVRPGEEVDVLISGYTGSLDQKIRFDVFALDETPETLSQTTQTTNGNGRGRGNGNGNGNSNQTGGLTAPATVTRLIVANNPNSGALGVIPEPSAAIVFAVGAMIVGGATRRIRR
jgi:hypothetical protein